MRQKRITYATERLILKPTDIEDAEFIYELLNSPGWLKNIGDRNVHSTEDAARYIQDRMLKQYNERGFGNFTVIRKTDQAKMGTSGIYARPGMQEVDIGFSMLPEYMAKGYSYEAAKKMMWLAEHEFNLENITAITTRENVASQNLIKKLGLKYIQDIKIENDDEILMQFGLQFPSALGKK